MEYYGIAGLAFILCGWLFELYDLWRDRKQEVPLEFALLYGAGSLLLTLHSLSLQDTVFIMLNGAATLIAVINIAFGLTRKRPKKGKK